MPDDCVFCNIVNKSIPAEILQETENLIVIRDIMPKAPTHLLVVSKKHIPSVNEFTADDTSLIGEMVLAGKDQAAKEGVAETGYKLIWNVGRHGGQVIPHVHLHVLGGKQLAE